MYLLILYHIIKLFFILPLLVIVYSSYIIYVRRKFAHIPGPPTPSFFFGHLPMLKPYHEKGKLVADFFLEMAEKYGPVYKLYILHRCLLLVTSPTIVKEFLLRSKYIKARETYLRMRNICGQRCFGTGILTQTDHETWGIRRSALNPAFHKKYLSLFMHKFNDLADRWVNRLNEVADGKTVISMHKFLCRVTLDAIFEVGFNHHMDEKVSVDGTFLHHLMNLLQAVSLNIRDPFLNINPMKSKLRNTFRSSLIALRNHGRVLLEEREIQINNKENVPEDFLTHMLKFKDEYEGVTIDDLLDDFITLFIAGQETTSNTLSFLFLEVGRNLDIYSRIQEEVDRVLDGKHELQFEDLPQLEYSGQVIKETLRLYPVAPGTARQTTEDCNIEGYLFPKNSHILISFLAIQRNAKNFAEPYSFNPNRFHSSAPTPLFTYMPFSLGPRACAGKQFALIESKVLLYKFFQNFEFKLDMSQSFAVEEMATLRPLDGTMLTLSKRNQPQAVA